MPGTHWTPDEIRIFDQHIRTHTAAEVAVLTGRSFNAVRARVYSLGIRKTAKAKSAVYQRSALRVPRGVVRIRKNKQPTTHPWVVDGVRVKQRRIRRAALAIAAMRTKGAA